MSNELKLILQINDIRTMPFTSKKRRDNFNNSGVVFRIGKGNINISFHVHRLNLNISWRYGPILQAALIQLP